MKTKEKHHIIDLLLRHRVQNRRKMIQASLHMDKTRQKVKGWNSVAIIRQFRGAI